MSFSTKTTLLVPAIFGLMLSVSWNRCDANERLAAWILQTARPRQGFCVHIGCGNGALTVELAKSGKHLVHGLSLEASNVPVARRLIEDHMLHGVATVDFCPLQMLPLKALPFADAIVNLIIVDDLPRVMKSGCTLQELLRVLAPQGVALIGNRPAVAKPRSETELREYLKTSTLPLGMVEMTATQSFGVWARFEKARPTAMDEWTHAGHGPDRNPVSLDRLVEPPNNLRWISGPRWLGTNGVQLSAGGRNVYSDGTVRDAFNGLKLFSLRSLGRYKYVTPHLAISNRIYLTAPRASKFLQAADASSGEILHTYEAIKAPKALAYFDRWLLFVNEDGVGSVNSMTGQTRWLNESVKVERQPPRGASVLVVAGERVLVQSSSSPRSQEKGRLVCLSRETGKLLWSIPDADRNGDLLFFADGVVVCCDSYRTYPKRIYAHAIESGKFLWQSPPMHEGKSVGVYAIDGLIWCQHNRQMTGFDPQTGQIKKTFQEAPGTFKCAQPAATSRFVSSGSLGFFDLSEGTVQDCRLDRNGCGSNPGVLFSNGLTYSFPKQCSCFSMMRSYSAYASDAPLTAPTDDFGKRLLRGDAYSAMTEQAVEGAKSSAVKLARRLDWPMFRHDPQRSASTDSAVALPLQLLWSTRPENQTVPDWLHDDWHSHPASSGPVSPPVISAGTICVALTNSHRVLALDAKTGETRWSFTAGGRVLVPPTLVGGRCLFGSQDGCAYCLRLQDGALIWKFNAAPVDRRLIAHGQLESLWPVSGGVLVSAGRAYFAAGRLSNLVGGLTAYAVDVRSGSVLWRRSPPTGYEHTQSNRVAPAYRNDLPVSGQGVIQLGHPRWVVSPETGEFAKDLAPVTHNSVRPLPLDILTSTRDGLLDFSRSRYQGPTDMGHGLLAQEFGDVRGQQIVVCEDRILGFQLPSIRTRYYNNKQSQQRNGLRLVAWNRDYSELWTRPLAEGTEFHAMIRAGRVIFTTGTRRNKDRPYRTGMLWAFDVEDGSELLAVELTSLPCSEALAVANGCLFVTTQDGQLLCYGKK